MNKFLTFGLISLASLLAPLAAQAATSTASATIAVSAFVLPVCNVTAASGKVSASCNHSDVSYTVRQVQAASADASDPTLSMPVSAPGVVLTVITY